MISAICIAALLGAVVPTLATDTVVPTLATDPYANGQTTETIGAQEVGTTTIDGHLVYSMNYCTVVHNTMCQVSLSTDGYLPPTHSSAPGYSAPETYASVPSTYGEPGGTTTDALTPTATYVGTPTGVATSTSSTGETNTGAPPESATPTGSGAMVTAVAGNVFVAIAAALFI